MRLIWIFYYREMCRGFLGSDLVLVFFYGYKDVVFVGIMEILVLE